MSDRETEDLNARSPESSSVPPPLPATDELPSEEASAKKSAGAAPEAAPSLAPRTMPWASMTLWLLLGGLLALLLWQRRLSPEEARLLVDMTPPEGWLERWQQGWSLWAGTMERPARALSFILVWFGLGLVGVAAARRGGRRAAMAALLTGAAWPITFLDGTGLGTSAAAFFAVSALLALGAALLPSIETEAEKTGAGPSSGSARTKVLVALGAIAAAATPWLVHRLAPESATALTKGKGWEALAPWAPGYGWLPEDVTPYIWPCLIAAALFALFAFRGRRALAAALTAAIPLLGFLVVILFQPDAAENLTLWVGAAIPPIALAVSQSFDLRAPRAGRRPTLLVIVVLFALALSGAWRSVEGDRAADRIDARATLDWLTYRVDQRSWVLILGPDRHLVRYYEQRGHYAGQQTRLVHSDDEARVYAERASFFDVPRLALVGATPEQLAYFEERYEVAPPLEGQPSDLQVLRPRRRR